MHSFISVLHVVGRALVGPLHSVAFIAGSHGCDAGSDGLGCPSLLLDLHDCCYSNFLQGLGERKLSFSSNDSVQGSWKE